MLSLAVKGLFHGGKLELCLAYLVETLREGLTIGKLVPYEVVYGLDGSPMSIIVDLCVLVKDSLLRAC